MMCLRILAFVIFAEVSANVPTLNNILFNGDYEFIDLTHPFDNLTVYLPGSQNFVFTKKDESYRKDGVWLAANEFAAAEHGGTHIDAPYHVWNTGQHVDELLLKQLIVPLIVVDISSQVLDNADFVLFKNHLDYLLNHNMDKPCLIIFKFGWSKYFQDRQKYLGIKEKTNTLTFPGLSVEVTEWLTSTYGSIVGIGVDLASVDPGSSADFAVHRAIAKKGLYNIENVNLNNHVPNVGCTALVLPMKIAQGTGAPVRLVAICPK